MCVCVCVYVCTGNVVKAHHFSVRYKGIIGAD